MEIAVSGLAMVICLQDIEKSFASGFLMRRKVVLRGLYLTIQPGDAYALLGSNGAGKSTTLRILLGLSRPDHGTGHLLGLPLGDRAARARLGYLPENPTFHEQLTPTEFLTYCGQLLGLRRHALQRRIPELLEKVQLSEARDRRLRKLSKGMLQRLGLAQVLLGDPELLVLDEPMSGLDPPGRKLVRDLILEERQAGKTVLFSTHILSDAEVVCTRAGILRDGCISRELQLDDLRSLGSETVEVTARGLDRHQVKGLEPLALSALRSGQQVLFVTAPGRMLHDLVTAVLAAGGQLESVVPRRSSLEEVYMDVTRRRRETPEPEQRTPPQPVQPDRQMVGSRS